MERYKKTYGVEGLVDWTAELRAGKAKLIINFTGGGMTSFGITPAEFTTDNPIHQAIIENSREFKRGKIKLLRGVKMQMPMKNVVKDFDTIKKDLPSQRNTIDTVSNFADAAKWMKQNLDINVYGKKKEEILRIAAENGVDFPNLSV